MTEEEARKRWCPFARIAGWPYVQSGDQLQKLSGVAAINRDTDTDEIAEGTHCLASGCMAWRGNREGGWCGLAGDPA